MKGCGANNGTGAGAGAGEPCEAPETESYEFTSPGLPDDPTSCDWTCTNHTYRNGTICAPCPTDCGEGEYLTGECGGDHDGTACNACQEYEVGQYLNKCSGRDPGGCTSCNYTLDGTEYSIGPGFPNGTCPCTVCEAGFYNGYCGNDGSGNCTACTNANANEYYTTGGHYDDECPVAECPQGSCQAGEWLSGCEGSRNGTDVGCNPATLPDGHYWTTNGGMNATGCEYEACRTCEPGQQRVDCQGNSPGECEACAPKPENSAFVDGECTWQCDDDFFRNSSAVCSPCENDCAAGFYQNGCVWRRAVGRCEAARHDGCWCASARRGACRNDT
ncbi:hypothetical protein RI054_26g109430 [Pseudoscourfieldia marina]